MIVLAIDTALGACSVAVGDETRLFAARYEERAAGQAERLIPMMDEALQEAGIPADAVTRIGVTVGPGSFTGTRIGLAAGRAMGVALGIPVIGITTLEALAIEAPAECAALVAFDARREQIYVQMFAPVADGAGGARPTLTRPLALSLDAAARALPRRAGPVALLGSAAEALARVLPQDRFSIVPIAAPYPTAATFLPLIARAISEPSAMPRPLYLRAAAGAAQHVKAQPGHAP